jgi:hypothetical protein
MPAAMRRSPVPPSVESFDDAEACLRAAGFADIADGLATVKSGGRFEAALGLPPSWPRQARLHIRNAAYRELAEQIAGALSVRRKAPEVERSVGRYKAGPEWAQDRRLGRDSILPGDLRRRLKFDIVSNSGKNLPGIDRLRQILENNE